MMRGNGEKKFRRVNNYCDEACEWVKLAALSQGLIGMLLLLCVGVS